VSLQEGPPGLPGQDSCPEEKKSLPLLRGQEVAGRGRSTLKGDVAHNQQKYDRDSAKELQIEEVHSLRQGEKFYLRGKELRKNV